MDNGSTVCQKITAALLVPHTKLTIPQLARETGVSGGELLPVVNRLIRGGYLEVRGNRVMRKTFLSAEGF
jgi:DNA-binding GntR family transcriptional regulator